MLAPLQLLPTFARDGFQIRLCYQDSLPCSGRHREASLSPRARPRTPLARLVVSSIPSVPLEKTTIGPPPPAYMPGYAEKGMAKQGRQARRQIGRKAGARGEVGARCRRVL